MRMNINEFKLQTVKLLYLLLKYVSVAFFAILECEYKKVNYLFN